MRYYRSLSIAAMAMALTACGQEGASPEMRDNDGEANPPGREIADSAEEQGVNRSSAVDPRMEMEEEGAEPDLEAILAAEDRSEDDRARDIFRHPVETIEFFGIEPSDTVVEVWPGSGWYTEILARYLAEGGGKLYAAGFDPESENERVRQSVANFSERFTGKPDVYGDVELSVLTQDTQDIAPEGSADVVVTFRNVHNFEMGGWSSDAFSAFYDALKPGGVLGVVDHRLPEDAEKGREQTSGYLKVSTVRQLAEDAGFVFDGESEINANPDDDTMHPFGVWTLPPNSRTTDRNGETPEEFDAQAYRDIGESDRMTLRFVKPEEPEESLLE
jgi:predicted methyltransferase